MILIVNFVLIIVVLWLIGMLLIVKVDLVLNESVLVMLILLFV